MLNLDAIKARLMGITPGQWETHECDRCKVFDLTVGVDHLLQSHYIYDGDSEGAITSGDDAAFIAHAPADIRVLLGEIERLQALEKAISTALGFGDLTLSYGAHFPNQVHCHLLAFDDNGNEFDYDGEGLDETQAITNVLSNIMIAEDK